VIRLRAVVLGAAVWTAGCVDSAEVTGSELYKEAIDCQEAFVAASAVASSANEPVLAAKGRKLIDRSVSRVFELGRALGKNRDEISADVDKRLRTVENLQELSPKQIKAYIQLQVETAGGCLKKF
jgi:hypothetical protein